MATHDKKPGMEKTATKMEIMDAISKGQSRADIVQSLVDDGITYRNAQQLYYEAMKDMTPDINLLDDYKRGMMQQNLDRLEKIINSSIEGNAGDKKVALQAIAEMNKMLGLSQGNNVTINKNNQGDEQIVISFQ